MRTVVEYRSRDRKVGIVIKVERDSEDLLHVTCTERGVLHTARGGIYADHDYAFSLANGMALRLDCAKVDAPAAQMVSPLAESERSYSRTAEVPSGSWGALLYAIRFGYVQAGPGVSVMTLRALASRELVELDTDPNVRFRVRGAYPTDRGRKAIEREMALLR